MAKVTKAKEFMVTVSNKVGSLACLLCDLADAGINMIAMSGSGKGREGSVRFVTDNAAKTARVLKKCGLKAKKGDAVLVELPNKPGAGAKATERLADAGINLASAYVSAVGDKALLVLEVKKPAAAIRALKGRR